jgi:RNA polymerase-binding transcription factor
MNFEPYRKRLLQLKKELESRRDRDVDHARETLTGDVQDTGDSSVSDVAIGDDFIEAELNSTVLQQIDDALHRIDNGTYGKCLGDGKPMPEKRLKAVPWAAYCEEHQARLEGAERGRDWTL